MPDSQLPEKDPRGGARRNAGRKKGVRNKKTVLREKIAEELALREALADDIRMLLPMAVRKKGLSALPEVAKEEIEKEVDRRIGYQVHKLLNAQISLALGTQHLYKVHQTVKKNGSVSREHILVTDPNEIKEYLDDPTKVQGSDYFYITTRNPDLAAINSALDRLLGKASTKIVGPSNPDGSDGPIKVVVANFSAAGALPANNTQVLNQTVGPAIQEAITEAVEEDSYHPVQEDSSATEDVTPVIHSYGN